MITLLLANIGPTSGEMEDGFFIGGVNKSNPVAVLMGDSLVNIEPIVSGMAGSVKRETAQHRAMIEGR